MINAAYRKYKNYDDFISDVMFTVIFDGYAAIICNWQDAQGVLSSLFQKTINGRSMVLNLESAYSFDDEIVSAQMNDGNVIITVCNDCEIICEAAIFTNKPECFANCKHFIEYDASEAVNYAITGLIIPFKIEQKVKL